MAMLTCTFRYPKSAPAVAKYGGPMRQVRRAPRAACRSTTPARASLLSGESKQHAGIERRSLLASLTALTACGPSVAADQGYEPMDALKGKDYGKSRMRFDDFTLTQSGLQYKDMRPGEGEVVQAGDAVTVDWDGYTIGYYGRPFEARNKSKGGAFTGDEKDFLRFTLGKGQVIPAFEEALIGMQVGGIRRLIVPVELGYPDNDMRKAEPKPTTFSGKRALGFVLENQGMIDKTLLFDVELIRISK